MPNMSEARATAEVSAYLQGLQQSIMQCVAELDSSEVRRDVWEKAPDSPLQGQGLTMMLEDGPVFERAGCGFSCVRGRRLPASATQHRPHLAGAPFEAMGVSLVFHPHNPHAPTVHMNVRMIEARPADAPAIQWFGGGMDLTPVYGYQEDARHFHQTCKSVLDPLNPAYYPRFKAWCDEYFFLPHRQEARGVGGVFFDDLDAGGFAHGFAVMKAVGNAFLQAYLPILGKRKDMPFGPREKHFQRYRRGRYVEFNLVCDRGTHFGLQSGGRTESILLSMPRHADWAYDWHPEPDSPEARLYTDFLPPRTWVQ